MSRVLARCLRILALLFAVFPGAAGAGETAVLLAADLEYESNPWLLSGAERAAFRRNPDSLRFVGIESLSDYTLGLFASAAYRPGTEAFGWQYRVAGAARRYARNDRLDAETVYLEARNDFARGKNVKLFVEYTPEEFVGESGGVLRTQEFVSHLTVGGNYVFPLGPRDRLLLSPRYGRDNYTEAFDDQDSDLFTLRSVWRRIWNGRWTTRAELWWRRRDSDRLEVSVPGRDEAVNINEISSHSYRADALIFYRFDRRTRLSGVFRYVYKRYTTDSRDDLRHFGRRDETYLVKAGATRSLTANWSADVFVSYYEKDTNLDPEESAYDGYSISAGIRYRF